MVNYEGQHFEQYILYERVGRGESTDVYNAWDDRLSRWVAIKVLHKGVDAEELEQFQNEARIMANLKHPHVITVFAYNEVTVYGVNNRFYTLPYYIMEYASKGSLAERYPYGERLPLDILMQCFRQIVEGLEYIHNVWQDNGRLVHLDIKPSNLLLGANDEILIGDFGIARYMQDTYSPTVSASQDTIGTPIYMAPERFRGQPCPATDQYSLGIMLYEWLTGSPPFDGSDIKIVQQQLNEPPPLLRAISPDVSPAVEQVVLKALRKNPYSRFASVRELFAALEEATHPSFPRSLLTFLY